MRPPLTAEQAAALIEKTTRAFLDAIPAEAADNPTVMGASIGALLGSMASVSGNAEMFLGSCVLIARGIMDGSLVDP